MRRGLLAAAAALALAAPPAAAQREAGSVGGLRVEAHAGAATEADVVARSWPTRTALFAGDRVDFLVELDCAPHVDVLLDDLAGDKLPLEGLELLSADHERKGAGGRTLYRFRYRLTTYETDAAALRIGERKVRYYARRASQRAAEAAPAGELRVPGAVLALRSTLPEQLAALAARAGGDGEPLPAVARWAGPLGAGLLLLSAAPVGLWLVGALRRAAAARGRRRPRQAPQLAKDALEELRGLDAASESERRAGYGRLEALLRRRIAELFAIPAGALTADEIAERLLTSARPVPEGLADVLRECERARYGRPELLPAAERFAAGVAAAGALVGARG